MAQWGKGNDGSKPKVTPERAFIYGVGALVVGGAIYFTGKQILKKKETGSPDNIDVNIHLPGSVIPSKRLSSGNDNFPLRQGSKGERVRQLQEAVQRIIGASAMKQFTPIDGDFGSCCLIF